MVTNPSQTIDQFITQEWIWLKPFLGKCTLNLYSQKYANPRYFLFVWGNPEYPWGLFFIFFYVIILTHYLCCFLIFFYGLEVDFTGIVEAIKLLAQCGRINKDILVGLIAQKYSDTYDRFLILCYLITKQSLQAPIFMGFSHSVARSTARLFLWYLSDLISYLVRLRINYELISSEFTSGLQL